MDRISSLTSGLVSGFLLRIHQITAPIRAIAAIAPMTIPAIVPPLRELGPPGKSLLNVLGLDVDPRYAIFHQILALLSLEIYRKKW
jgi:hypothetical protein